MSGCTFDREQLSLYVGDDLTLGKRLEVEAHLAGCAECAGVVAQYRRLGAGLRLALGIALSSPGVSREEREAELMRIAESFIK